MRLVFGGKKETFLRCVTILQNGHTTCRVWTLVPEAMHFTILEGFIDIITMHCGAFCIYILEMLYTKIFNILTIAFIVAEITKFFE